MPTKTKRKYPGIFITFEGIDGAGKSSHIDWLAQMLRAQGKNVVQSREPGGTPLGEQLRAILLRENMHPDTETLMLFTARREHLALVIEPALRQGHIVISDRFSDATYAYQCGGRGLSEVRFAALERWVHPDLQPDLTFLFDLAANVADERINRETRIRDRFEQEHASFHERVRDAYLRRARVMASRIRVIDAGRTMNEIRQELFQSLTDRLKEIESKTS